MLNMQPFSEIYYKDCYYNALFPVLLYLGKSIHPYLLNEIYAYMYDGKSGELRWETSLIHRENTLLDRMGIRKMEQTCAREALIGEINASLHAGRPVILFVDCYYESMRLDVHGKLHHPHFLLVYGCDERRELLHIMEHRYRDSFHYEQRELPWAEAVAAYGGALDHFAPQRELSTYSDYALMAEEHAVPLSDQAELEGLALREFAGSMLDQEARIRQGIESLRAFTEAMEAVFLNRELLAERAQSLLNQCAAVLNGKRIEQYRLAKVFGARLEGLDDLQTVQEHYTAIRTAIGKFLQSGVFNEKSMRAALSKFNEIAVLEERMHHRLFILLHGAFD